MIKITFYTKSDKFVGLVSKGHADYEERGKDIVCSAVSTITQSLALGIIKVLRVKANYKIDEDTGYLELRLPELKDEALFDKTQVLFNTALLSLKDFQIGFPSNIKVEVKDL